jgi:hypothetical protein
VSSFPSAIIGVEALVSEVDVAEFEGRPHTVLTNIQIEWIELVGNA